MVKPRSKKEGYFSKIIEEVEHSFSEEREKRQEKKIWKKARKRLQRRQLKKIDDE